MFYIRPSVINFDYKLYEISKKERFKQNNNKKKQVS